MIPANEIRERAAQFGVPEDQVVRDYLISHVIQALSTIAEPAITFFGGTALCRTWCGDSRLSEDIDLLVDHHLAAAQAFPALITRALRREFPNAVWSDVERRHEVDTKMLYGGDGTVVKVQFVQWRRGWEILPVARTAVDAHEIGRGFVSGEQLFAFEKSHRRSSIPFPTLADDRR